MNKIEHVATGPHTIGRLATWLVGCLMALPAAAYDVPKLNTLYNFTPAEYAVLGNFELSPLVEGSDGDLYGVSAYGGAHTIGFVYKVSRSTGQITHLHDFGSSSKDGVTPRGALVQGRDGFLYGTTESGGRNQSDYCFAGKFYNASGCGTLFRVSPDGRFQKLHDFYSEADGYQASPNTSATTSMFKMTHDGSVSVFHLFPEDESEGYLAEAGLVLARDGNLYGTTSSFGAIPGKPSGGCGTIFRAGTDGSFATLYVFRISADSVADGCSPTSRLLQGRDGNLYGTTLYGGYQQDHCIAGGCGTVFRVSLSGEESVLHRFTATARDGEYPQADGIAQTPDGTLYGATGGNPYGEGFGFVPLCRVGGSTAFSCGTLWKIDPRGRFSQLEVFGAGDGAYGLFPHGSLISASDGNLYGNTFAGGGYGFGTIYRLVLDSATPIVSIDGLQPANGDAGTNFSAIGTGFTGASQLTIGNGTAPMPIPFTVVSDSQIDAQVPAGAVTSTIGVTTPRGTTFSPVAFTVGPGPQAARSLQCERTSRQTADDATKASEACVAGVAVRR
jgi:uncharacterized repeat protein (TIGR03803 family)